MVPTELTSAQRGTTVVGLGWRVAMVVSALTGLAMRVGVLTSDAGSVNSDEAVVGLIAKRMLEGEWPAFFWGQHYGGTLEAALVSAARLLTGTTVVALKLVPIVLSAVAAVLVWRVGRRLIGERPAQTAAALFWLGPAAYVWLATKEYEFYWASLCLGLALVLSALRLVDDPSRRIEWLWAGLLAGLGWWTSPMVLYVAVPLAVWLVARHRALLRDAWQAVPTALIGALPWIVHNVGHGLPSLDQPPQPEHIGYAAGAGRLFWHVLPIVVGLRRVRSEHWLLPLMPSVFAALAVAFVLALVWRRRRVPGLLLTFIAVFPVIYVTFPGRWWSGDARYALLLWPFLALVIACLLTTSARSIATMLVVALLSVAGVQSIGVTRPPVHLGGDIRQLHEMGVDHLWTDYWLAYRLTFESDEEIIASPTRNVRYTPYVEEIRADPSPAVAYLSDDSRVEGFRAAAVASGARFREARSRSLIVFLFDGRLSFEGIPSSVRP